MSWPRKREYVYIAVAAFLAALYAIVGTMDYEDALIAEATQREAFAMPCTWISQSGGSTEPRFACVSADFTEGK